MLGVHVSSILGFTVFHEAVCDVVDLQQLLVVVFLHFGVDCPGDHFHPPLGPVLNVVPADTAQTTVTHTRLNMTRIRRLASAVETYTETKFFWIRKAETPQSFHST